MARKVAFRLWALALLSLALAGGAWAQTTASIQGSVTDPTGAAIVGAKITVENLGQRIQQTTQTTSTGSYEVPALPPGRYNVKVEVAGFQIQEAKGVVLEVSQNSVQNFNLKVANSAGEVVEVEATAPVVETTTMTVGQTIDQRTVQEIPLNGRHFVDLALLIPGTVTPPQNGFLTAPLRGQGSFAFNTAGNREDSINFMINGINLNDMVQNQVTYQPVINTVSEFKVDNSTYSAEYGRNAGSIVNIATRSGTEQFHGELYDFLRNNFFDARNAFNPTTTLVNGVVTPSAQAPFKRNQFGGDFGGPIKKGKTYFFLSYEGVRQRQGLTTNSPVLTDTQRAQALAGNNAIVKSLLGLIPEGNGGTANAPLFFGSATAPVNIDQGTADISHNFSDADRLHGYWAYQNDLRQEPTQGANIPGFGDTRNGHRQVLTLSEDHVFDSTLVNEARIGANRIHILFSPNNLTDPNTLGLGALLGPNLAFIPAISITGDVTLGAERNFPQGRGDTTYVASDTLSYIKGAHSFKFGGEFRDFRNDNFNGDPGSIQFTGLPNKNPALSIPSTQDFINGIAIASRTEGNVANRITENALDFFAMDSYKFKSNLTVELGIRYAWNFTPTEADNRFVVFNPVNASLVQVGSPGFSNVYGQNNTNFQPRVGFAWDVFKNNRTVLRGGYAFQVDQPITGFVTGLNSNPPFALPISVTTRQPLANLPASFNGVPGSISPSTINPNFTNADVQSWNLNLQQQITRDTAIMVGYFGTKGTHLEVDQNINQPLVLGNTTAGNPSLPFPVLGVNPFLPAGTKLSPNILERQSDSNSSYNALWITATKHLSHGFQMDASYTWSHSIDDNSRNAEGIVVQNSANIAGDRGNSDFDARNRFVVNGIYNLPFTANRVVSGWEFSTILSLQSGNPFSVFVPGAGINGINNTVRANVTGPVAITGNALGNWFAKPAVFTAPGFAFGNSGRNAYVGPGFEDLDFSVVKNTKLTEKLNIQLRGDAFDLLNHPNFGQPSGALGTQAFGTITTTRFPTGDSGSSRQLQLALKFQF